MTLFDKEIVEISVVSSEPSNEIMYVVGNEWALFNVEKSQTEFLNFCNTFGGMYISDWGYTYRVYIPESSWLDVKRTGEMLGYTFRSIAERYERN